MFLNPNHSLTLSGSYGRYSPDSCGQTIEWVQSIASLMENLKMGFDDLDGQLFCFSNLWNHLWLVYRNGLPVVYGCGKDPMVRDGFF